MGLCAKKGGWFEGSRTASISPRPPSPAVPHASSFESTSGAGDFGHPATSTRSSWGDFAQRGERARDWGGGEAEGVLGGAIARCDAGGEAREGGAHRESVAMVHFVAC